MKCLNVRNDWNCDCHEFFKKTQSGLLNELLNEKMQDL